MGAMKRFRRILGLALLLGTLGVPSAEAGVVIQPPVVELTTWRPTPPRTLGSPARKPIVNGHLVGLFIDGGHCIGGPKPGYHHVTVAELPMTERRPFKAAVITAYRLWPEYSYVPEQGPTYGDCLPNRDRTIFHRIRTKRPATELRFYDGYFSPPRQVWPPVRGGPRTLR
jgi:hypothetical protein